MLVYESSLKNLEFPFHSSNAEIISNKNVSLNTWFSANSLAISECLDINMWIERSLEQTCFDMATVFDLLDQTTSFISTLYKATKEAVASVIVRNMYY